MAHCNGVVKTCKGESCPLPLADRTTLSYLSALRAACSPAATTRFLPLVFAA